MLQKLNELKIMSAVQAQVQILYSEPVVESSLNTVLR